MEYLFFLLSLICIYFILTMTANMLIGYLGILYLGHPAVYGIGAYTFALLMYNGVTTFWPAVLAGGVISMIAAVLLALPALRLRSHYIGMTTLAFLLITNGLLLNLRNLTRGALGIPGITRPSIFGTTLQTNAQFFAFILVFTITIGFILYKVANSPFGKTIETIREDELAAQSIGKNTGRIKMQVFALGGFIAGITGGLMASFLSYINPWTFGFEELVKIIVMVILGGMASFWGSLAGAAIILLLPEALRFVEMDAEKLGAIRLGLYGLIIIFIMILKPYGLFGKRTNIFTK